MPANIQMICEKLARRMSQDLLAGFKPWNHKKKFFFSKMPNPEILLRVPDGCENLFYIICQK